MKAMNSPHMQTTTLAEQIVTAIRTVVGAGPVVLHEPSFTGNEWLYLKECLDSTFVSSVGKFVDRFEADLASFTDAKHAVAVVNGTAALHIALKLAGVKADDEVLIPALTFVATANAVTYCNATPHFVDSEARTLGVDAAKLPHAWEYRHDEIGYNYRMPNLNAALGCAQLEQLPTMLTAKRKLFQHYQTAFAPVAGVKLMAEPEQCQSNYWLQTLLLDAEQANQREPVLKATNGAGFMARPAWILMHELAPFKNCPRMDLAGAQSLSQRLINIPSSTSIVHS